jgi:hypothetical protein
VPKDILAEKKIDGKKWLAEVSKVLGGKVSPETMSHAAMTVRGSTRSLFRAAAKTSHALVSEFTPESWRRAWKWPRDGSKPTCRLVRTMASAADR